MKDEDAIRKELERQYLKRLQNRFERKLKCCCRNCRNHVEKEFDMGEFGKATKYFCSDGIKYDEHAECEKFNCIYTRKMIERELLDDLKDPAIASAKEPKIAALLWVLHDEDDNGFVSLIKRNIVNLFK